MDILTNIFQNTTISQFDSVIDLRMVLTWPYSTPFQARIGSGVTNGGEKVGEDYMTTMYKSIEEWTVKLNSDRHLIVSLKEFAIKNRVLEKLIKR